MKDLFADVPASARLKGRLALPSPLSEIELIDELKTLSGKNETKLNFLGGGIYPHFIPSAVKALVSRGEFYTAYTPYQAEASQGTLQAIYEYQSAICELTGMDVANASMYDGATAMAEAAFLACRATERKEVVVSSTVNPMYREVLKTYCNAADIKLTELPYNNKTGLTDLTDLTVLTNASCLILQQPNFFGCIEEVDGLADKVHASGALFAVSADPISLGLLKAPGEYGADVVVGEGQSLGIPMSFGGPLLGIMAVREKLIRQIPGRLVSRTADVDGKEGYILTLQAREQHIRRERAASNICSNEALCALSACIYLSLMGRTGLKKVAEMCRDKSAYLKKELGSVFSAPTFKEFAADNVSGGLDLGKFYPELKGKRLLSVTELYSKKFLEDSVKALRHRG